jgi:hypothetical protein
MKWNTGIFMFTFILAFLILAVACENTENTISMPSSSVLPLTSPTLTASASIQPVETTPASSISDTPEVYTYTKKSRVIRISLSGVPKPGETADLTVNIDTSEAGGFGQPKEGLAKASAQVGFGWTNIHGSYSEAEHGQAIPPDEVVVSGNSTWQGDALEKALHTFTCKIRFPREGIWTISGTFAADGWTRLEGADPIYVAVADGTAMFYYSKDFKSGPLAYLSCFPYGGVSNYPLEVLLTEDNPVRMKLDISRAPRVGEEAVMTCTVNSLHAVNNFKVTPFFDRRTADTIYYHMPGDDLIRNGALSWYGDLKPGVPLVLSAALKFPQEGEWRIQITGKSLPPGRVYIDGGYQDYLDITINNTRSYYGWPDRPEPQGGYKYIYSTPVYTDRPK